MSSPFLAFLLTLEADGFRLNPRDYDRIARVLASDGEWDIERLRDVLISLLARDEARQALLERRFDEYFDRSLKSGALKAPLDGQRLREELANFRPSRRARVRTFDPVRPNPPPQPPPRRKRRWPKSVAILTLLALLAAAIHFALPHLLPKPPRLLVNPPVLTIGAFTGGEESKELQLSNAGGGELRIQSLALDAKPDADQFRILKNACAEACLAAQQSCSLTIAYRSDEAGDHQADLRIISSAGSEQVRLKGYATEPETAPAPDDLDSLPIHPYQPQVPVIESIQRKPLDGAGAWHLPALLALLFLLAGIGFGIYLWRYRKTPSDEPPEWRTGPGIPRHFDFAAHGPKPSPRLDHETLSHLADSMGYFQGERASHRVDIHASVLATVHKGGIPEIAFERRKQLRNLIILEDARASDATAFNPIVEELREGMTRLGVPLLYGRFRGDPALFHTPDGRAHHLEDLESERNGYLLLIFADARSVKGAGVQHTLEQIAAWPQAAWFELRAREFRDAATARIADLGIPLYSADKAGLIEGFNRFLSEAAPQQDQSADREQWHGLPIHGRLPSDEQVEQLLGDALGWAQACAMVQPFQPALAEQLRQTERFCHLPPERIERLIALPGTQHSNDGLRFAPAVLAVLRRGFIERWPDPDQEEVLWWILARLEETWQQALKQNPQLAGSPAELHWQRHLQLVRLHLEPDAALKELSRLAASPLGGGLRAEAEAWQLADAPGQGIPLRKPPQTADGRQRLGRLAANSGIPPLEAYPLRRWQWAVSALLLAALVGNLGWAGLQYHGEQQQQAHLRIVGDLHPNLYLVLEGDAMQGELDTRGGQGVLLESDLPRGRYRLFMVDDPNATKPVWKTELEAISGEVEIRLGREPASQPPGKTALLIPSDPHGRILRNTRLTLRNLLDQQTLKADQRIQLPLGKWEVKATNENGLETAWQTLELTQDEQLRFAFTEPFHDKLEIGGFGPQMISIPGGAFTMGEGDDAHLVAISPFAMGRYEVTFDEYDRFAEATGRDKPDDEGWGRGDRPVITVSWEDATAYAQWLSEQSGTEYRLPSEAEWEYAARAGTETVYWWGDEADLDRLNSSGGSYGGYVGGTDQWKNTAPVGSFQPNPFALHDTAGNVYEWVNDWYGDYPPPDDKPVQDPRGPDAGSHRVVRGGSWDFPARDARSAFRDRGGPSYRLYNLGFRLARTDPRPSYPLTLGGDDSANPPTAPEQTAPQPTGGDSQPRRQWAPFAVFKDATKAGTEGPAMVYIPADSFRMGDIQGKGGSDEKPVHEVKLNAYAIGRTEVTNAEYVAFLNQVGGRGTEEESWFETKEEDGSSHIIQGKQGFEVEEGYEDHPVINVSWYGAVSYAKWLSQITGEQYRLPSEAEWEHAARADTETVYWWGDEASRDHMNFGKEPWGGHAEGADRWVETAPVASFPENPFGLYDTAGNVWEWVSDWYGEDYYANSPVQNPLGPEKGSYRVVRGGSWYDPARNARSASRDGSVPGDRADSVGFRLARTVP